MVWSGQLGGEFRPASLAWEFDVYTDLGLERRVWIDATTGEVLGTQQIAAYQEVRRSLWDRRALTDAIPECGTSVPYDAGTCTYWSCELDGDPTCCADPSVVCPECVGVPPELCPCPHPGREGDDPRCCGSSRDDAACADNIWRYNEDTGCVADGVPPGELDCERDCTRRCDAAAAWSDLERVWDFWWRTFERDSWDGAGDWMFAAVGDITTQYVGRTSRADTDADTRLDVCRTNFREGETGAELHGHEAGHCLLFGAVEETGNSPLRQDGWVNEHLADVNGARYQGREMGNNCDPPDNRHYMQCGETVGGQRNKFIGDCNSWLIHQATVDQDPDQAGYQFTHFGVPTTSTTGLAYDRSWYRALEAYLTSTADYFDWWEYQFQAAFDLYGPAMAPEWHAVIGANDAIGRWEGYRDIGAAAATDDRIAAVSVPEAAYGPCVFVRSAGTASRAISWSCFRHPSWTPLAPFNDPLVDPAASEPSATFRRVGGTYRAYVFWRGTDSRIWYRVLSADTLDISGPATMGDLFYTSAVPAAAPLREASGDDRLIIVYKGLGTQSDWFFWTWLGSPTRGVATSWRFDSDVPPSLVSYPYPDRIYLFRADPAGSEDSRHLKYTSFPLADGTDDWTDLADLTALYDAMPGVGAGVVRTDRGVTIAEYSRSTRTRLNFVFRRPSGGLGNLELWHGALVESEPGVLAPDGFRVVPFQPIPLTPLTSWSAGGLVGKWRRGPLFHITLIGGRLSEARKYSD